MATPLDIIDTSLRCTPTIFKKKKKKLAKKRIGNQLRRAYIDMSKDDDLIEQSALSAWDSTYSNEVEQVLPPPGGNGDRPHQPLAMFVSPGLGSEPVSSSSASRTEDFPRAMPLPGYLVNKTPVSASSKLTTNNRSFNKSCLDSHSPEGQISISLARASGVNARSSEPHTANAGPVMLSSQAFLSNRTHVPADSSHLLSPLAVLVRDSMGTNQVEPTIYPSHMDIRIDCPLQSKAIIPPSRPIPYMHPMPENDRSSSPAQSSDTSNSDSVSSTCAPPPHPLDKQADYQQKSNCLSQPLNEIVPHTSLLPTPCQLPHSVAQLPNCAPASVDL